MYFSPQLKVTSYAKIDPTPKRQKIAEFRLQILVGNLQRFLKRTYFFKIKEKMTKLRCLKVGANLNSKIVVVDIILKISALDSGNTV